MITLIESHRQERAERRVDLAPTDAGVRWGKAADFNFDQTDAEADNEARGGISQVQRQQNRIMIWNLSPVWRAFDVVEIESSHDPEVTIEATVTRQMLVPVGSSTQRYVGGGIGYVEDPGDYGFETRTIHTFLLLSLPSPVPDAPVVDSGVEGAWPTHPEEAIPPGKFTPLAAVPGPWLDQMARPRAALHARHGGAAAASPAGRPRGPGARQRRPLGQALGVLLVERGGQDQPGGAEHHEPDPVRSAGRVHAHHPGERPGGLAEGEGPLARR